MIFPAPSSVDPPASVWMFPVILLPLTFPIEPVVGVVGPVVSKFIT